MTTERAWPDVAIAPGEVLAEELAARGLTQSQLARAMRRPLQAINEIVRGRKRITGETALQLAEALGTSAEFWIRLEADYELTRARLAAHMARERPPVGRSTRQSRSRSVARKATVRPHE
jgi:addiction module HigA family antidote